MLPLSTPTPQSASDRALLDCLQSSNHKHYLLSRSLTMDKCLGKFSSHLAEISQPLRELLSPNNAWLWSPRHQVAFNAIKNELARPTVLALYNPLANLKISADASSFGLGAVLLQKSSEEWKPVAYASCPMSAAEKYYAQIEKEALAVKWACEKFHELYILGNKFSTESDHKPLIPLLSIKSLDHLPPQIVWFHFRLDRYTYTIQHVAGKELHTADTLFELPSQTLKEKHWRKLQILNNRWN